MARTSKTTAKKAKAKTKVKAKPRRPVAARGKTTERGQRLNGDECPMCGRGYGGETSMHRTRSRGQYGGDRGYDDRGYADYNSRTSDRGGQERFMDESRLSRRRGPGEDDRFYRSRMRGSRYAEDEDYGPASRRNGGSRVRDWSGEPERYAEAARNSHDYD